MAISVVNTPTFAPVAERMQFSQAVKSGSFLFCSGVTGTDAGGKAPAELDAEFRMAFDLLKMVLAEAGASMTDIVEMTTYHVDMENTMQAFFPVRGEYLSAPWCAWSAIGVSSLFGGAKVEIRAVAELG